MASVVLATMSTASDPQAAPTTAPGPYLLRLERLTHRLLGRRFRTAQDLWQIELDLLQIERDLQAAITTAKDGARRDGAYRPSLEALREVRWHARRLGDAYAWLLLRGEPQQLYPLAENERVPIDRASRYWTGLTQTAIAMANRGFGFPILNDVTDQLRVGDLTFVRFDAPPRTVEVKSKVVAERPTERGSELEYRVRAIWPSDGADAGRTDTITTGPTPEPLARHPRDERQLARLSRAHAATTAAPGLVMHGDDRMLTIVSAAHGNLSADWRCVRRLVREARRVGYASAPAHGAFLHVAVHEPTGVALATVKGRLDRIRDDLPTSGVLTAQSRLLVSAVPDPRPGGPQLQGAYERIVPLVLERVRLGADDIAATVALYQDAGESGEMDTVALARIERERDRALTRYRRTRDAAELEATMRRLDAEEQAARHAVDRAPLTPAEVVACLRDLPRLWADGQPEARRGLAEALFARVRALGVRRIEIEPTETAVEHGLAEACGADEVVMVGARGVGTTITMSSPTRRSQRCASA